MTLRHTQIRRLAAKVVTSLAIALFVAKLSAETESGESNTWRMIGPGSATIFSGARSPDNPNLFMVGTYYGGIYRSFDGGRTWQHLDSSLSSAAVFSLRADGMAPGTFYAGAFERGVYRTTDYGQTWLEQNQGLTNRSVVGIAVNPLNNQELLAATYGGIFCSSDAGATWNAPAGLGLNPALSVHFSPATDGVCYAGMNQSGVLRSTDSGNTWAAWNQGLAPDKTVLWIETDPDDPDVVYLATDRGVFRRAEGDPEWSDLSYNLPPGAVTKHLAFHPDGRLFVATEVGIFTLNTREATEWFNWGLQPSRFVFIEPFGSSIHVAETELTFQITVNDGISFADASIGIQNNFPDALASVANGGTSMVFAGTDFGPLRTTGPQTPVPPAWQVADELLHELILELRPTPNQPNIIFAGTERAGVWRSDDMGETWQQKSDGIVPNQINSLCQSPVGDHITYAGTSTGLFVSDDGGRNWRVGPAVAIPSFVSAAAADAAAPEVAYFGTNFGEILTTINGGKTFRSSLDLPDEPVARLASARFRSIYAVTGSGRVFASADQGVIWEPKDQEIQHPGSDLEFSQARPWVGYLSTLGGGVYRTESDAISWSQVNTGIDNPFLFSIAVDRTNEDIVYAGSVGTIYKTTNQGTNWTAHAQGLPAGAFVTDIELHPTDDEILFASVLGHGIYVSEDGGNTWAARGTDVRFVDKNPVPIAISYSEPGTLLSGSRLQGVLRTDDLGVAWQESSTGMSDLVRAVQVSHQDPTRVYAGTLNSGMFLSENGGQHWSNIGLEKRRIIHASINRFDDRDVFAATDNGIVASRDGGENWHDLGQRLAFVFAMVSDPVDRDRLFLGGPSGLFYASYDGGVTSVKGGTGLPDANIRALFRTGNGLLFAGMGVGGGVYRSEDDGDNWQKISGERFSNERANGLWFDDVAGELYVTGDKSGLHKTDATGSSWSLIPTPGGDPVVNPISAFRVDPFDEDRFVVAKLNQSGDAMSLHFSSDQGLSWNTVAAGDGLPPGTIWTVEFSPHQQGLVLACHESGVYRSTDGGVNWSGPSATVPGILYRLLFDETEPQKLFAANVTGGIYLSNDGGMTWAVIGTEPASPQVSALVLGKAGKIHAGTFENGVMSTHDGGATWSTGIDADLAQFVANFISLDPANSRTIYVATSSQGVLKSTNRGESWKRMNQGLADNLTALSIIVDPKDPDTLYLGTISDGVYFSENGAESWQPLGCGMHHELVIALTTDAIDHRTVYAGVEGGGVYQLRRQPKNLAGGRDHDNDGTISLIEEYMGLDPLNPNPPGIYYHTMDPVTSDHGVVWQESPLPTGINATPQWSPNLRDWYSSGQGPGGPGPNINIFDLGFDTEGNRLKEARIAGSGSKQFLRLWLSR